MEVKVAVTLGLACERAECATPPPQCEQSIESIFGVWSVTSFVASFILRPM